MADSPTPSSDARPEAPDLRRIVGFWGGIAVMIGVIIGSGIFRTPPEIAQHFGSPLVILGLWVLGGLVCLAGALTYAELAAMRPHSGGVYVFIREGFGDCAAFVFGWAYLVLVKPFAAGGIAFIFGEHVNLLATAIGRRFVDPSYEAHWDVRVSTTIMLLALTWVNVRGVRLSTALAGVLTALKFGALAAIVLLVIALSRVDLGGLRDTGLGAVDSDEGVLGGLAAVMAGILWTYDGWADVGSIAGEVREPRRTLPRIYVGGTIAIIGVYVAVNAAYFMLVPLPEMRERMLAAQSATPPESFSVAPLVMQRLLGGASGVAVVLVVLCSTLGSSHASIMTGARVSYAQARDGLLFRFIGHVHPRYGTPDAALISQVVLSVVAVWWLGSFQALAEGFVFTMWIFYALGGAAIFVFRARWPHAARPFACPGYPIVPAVFVLSALGMTGLAIYADRAATGVTLGSWDLGSWRFAHTAPWLGVLAAGAPVYWVWRRVLPRARAPWACRRCGYDLRGIEPAGVCPECGRSAL
ncbi:MAG TPA: amino acid permease [Phycisphaerales bacterium]|nr:amino acid permease [Phycisphaerales bacterium]